MKTKTIKTRLTAGLISLVMIFSLFATSAGAALAQTIQTPNTLTQQSGVVTEENNLNTPTEPQGTEAKTESGTATTENKTTENEQPAVVDGAQTQNNEAVAASAAQPDNNAITANAPTAAVASTQAAVNNKITFKVYGPFNNYLFDFKVALVDVDGKAIDLSGIFSSDIPDTYDMTLERRSDLQLYYVMSVESMLNSISKITTKLSESDKKHDFLEARYTTKAPDLTYSFINIGVNNPFDNLHKYMHANGGVDSNNYSGEDATNTLVFSKPLETIEGLDSTAEGVDIQMFDYNTSTPNMNTWGVGQHQNLVKRNLEKVTTTQEDKTIEEYIPVSNATGDDTNAKINTPLINNFSTSSNYYRGAANKLFLEDVYKKGGTDIKGNELSKGTFYYSSFENYAYWKAPTTTKVNLDAPSSDFTLYKQIGTPVDSEVNYDNPKKEFFFKRGNFMPFNEIEAGKLAKNVNSFDDIGKPLTDTAHGLGKALYKTKVLTKEEYPYAHKLEDLNNDSRAVGNDYFFGMVVTANFAQLENGELNGEDMVYEFNGDDDLWVFIDDVLVLDLGGIRDAETGSINFSTGNVISSCQATENTNIKDQFQKALVEKEGNSAKLDESDWKSGENTFADNTGHQIKIFYMERGAGASNCKMKFNLPVLPKNSITVAKEVTNINDGSYTDAQFKFKLYLENKEANESTPNTIKSGDSFYTLASADKKYDLKDGSGIMEAEKSLDSDGTFTLQHGQIAYFKEIVDNGGKYIVEETNVSNRNYDEFTANGTALDGDNILESVTEDGKVLVRTPPITAGEKNGNFVTFKNQCNGENLHTLNITKKMAEGQTSDDVFAFSVKIGGRDFGGKYTIQHVDGTKSEHSKGNNSSISIKMGETIIIPELAADTSFEIIEKETENGYNSEKYQNPTYNIGNATSVDINGKASGRIGGEGRIANVTVTNAKILSGLVIKKTINEANDIDGDPIFTFKITKLGTDGSPEMKPNTQEPVLVLYRTLRLSKEVGKTAQITVNNLPAGKYKVEELDTMRYTAGIKEIIAEVVDKQVTNFDFTNNLTSKGKYSHTDVVENSFKVDKTTGNIEWKKNDVPQGQTPNGEQNTQQPQQ